MEVDFMFSSFLTLLFLALPFSLSHAVLKSSGKTHLEFSPSTQSAQITVDEGFHFNIEAPTFLLNSKTKIAPKNATNKKIEFKWNGNLSEEAKIQYYVCDDGKTVCEPHTETLFEVKNKSLKLTNEKTEPTRSKIQIDKDGFIINDYQAALQKAQNKNNLIFIDFSASWCPPCIRLNHETFNTKTFKNSAKQYTLLKIDVDLDNSQSLLEKYSIHAFPTIVITNAKGEELDRILDFVPAESLANVLKEILKKRDISIEQLKKEALLGNKNSALLLAKNAYKSHQTAECLKWFEKAEQKPLEYFLCLLDQTEKLTNEEKRKNLQLSISANPNSFYGVEWRMQLADLFKQDNKAIESQNIYLELQLLIQKWIKDPEFIKNATLNNELIELKDLVIPELYYSLGDVYEALNNHEEAIKQYELAIQKAMDLKPSVTNPTIIIYLVHYLKKTHPIDEALVWLKKLESAYPTDFTYVQRQANLLYEAKLYSQALTLGEKAFDLSYGTNKLKTGLLLVKIKKDLKQVKEAKALLIELINSKSAQEKNNKSHLERLNETLIDLSK